MKRALTIAFASALVALVAGCGGDGGLFSTLYHGAIATSLEDGCRGRYVGIVANYTSEGGAEASALGQCRQAGGTECDVLVTFGSAYQGSNQCASVALGTASSGCVFSPGTGNTELTAEATALTRCRNLGFSCVIFSDDDGDRASECTD